MESYLDELLASGEFEYRQLAVTGIDNKHVLDNNAPHMREEETNLFHRDYLNGDEYCKALHERLANAIHEHSSFPVVRFADGEYAFYSASLACNGLYQQAESVEKIKKALPIHAEYLRSLNTCGVMTPLIHPGNTEKPKKGLLSFFKRRREEGTARGFLEFVRDSGVGITHDNYIPFYVVYAYLTSIYFSQLVDGRRLLIINSDSNLDECQSWFAAKGSSPILNEVELPASYVATRWPEMKKDVLNKIPSDTEICLVGAGIGSLLVCVDVALTFNIPAVDAGHVLNMMNGRVDKSNGDRLFTHSS